MKEAIGGSWIFIIVITLIMFFTAFVSLSTNYTRTYKIKDKIVSIIASKKGVSKSTIQSINKELRDIGYSSKSACPDDGGTWYGFSRTNNNGTVSRTKANYCIKRNVVVSKCSGRTDGAIGHPASNYYSVAVFFKIDFPVLGNMFQILVQGETSTISMPEDGVLPDPC